MLKAFRAVLFIAIMLVAVPAHASFSVDWGTSNDTGNFGFDDLGKWFSDNGYAPNQAAGSLFAQTGYIGFGGGDADPFSFAPGSYSFNVVQQIAGNSDLTGFGYYTGSGAGKALTGLLGAGYTGPTETTINENFGVYMNTPTSWRSTHYVNWFTDRAENEGPQSGSSTTNAGGDPQALIYQLGSNEWLIAWEDLDYTNPGNGQSDRDFNDAYLKVTVTPEPVSMALFGLGGAALGAAGLRRRRKN